MSISSPPQILAKQAGEPISEGGLIFQKPPDIGSPLAFSVNETLSFHNKCQNHSCVCDLGK